MKKKSKKEICIYNINKIVEIIIIIIKRSKKSLLKSRKRGNRFKKSF